MICARFQFSRLFLIVSLLGLLLALQENAASQTLDDDSLSDVRNSEQAQDQPEQTSTDAFHKLRPGLSRLQKAGQILIDNTRERLGNLTQNPLVVNADKTVKTHLQGVKQNIEGLLDKIITSLSSTVKSKLAPPKNYFSLIGRYQKWYNNYQSTEQSTIEPAVQLVSKEFLEEDEKLRQNPEYNIADPGQDHLYNVLDLVIPKLEAKLDQLKAPDSKTISTVETETMTETPGELNEEAFKEASERVKDILMRRARLVLKDELIKISTIATFNALAQMAAQVPPDSGTLLSFIAPVVTLMGGTSQPLLVSYLTNVQTRAAMQLILPPLHGAMSGLLKGLDEQKE